AVHADPVREIIVAIQLEGDAGAAVSRLDGLIYRAIGLRAVAGFEIILDVVIAGGEFETQPYLQVTTGHFDRVQQPAVDRETDIARAESMSAEAVVNSVL